MKNSINNLRNTLTSREKLSVQHLAAIKGGDGEDIRKNSLICPPPPPPPVDTTTVTKVVAG